MEQMQQMLVAFVAMSFQGASGAMRFVDKSGWTWP